MCKGKKNKQIGPYHRVWSKCSKNIKMYKTN